MPVRCDEHVMSYLSKQNRNVGVHIVAREVLASSTTRMSTSRCIHSRVVRWPVTSRPDLVQGLVMMLDY